MTPTHKTNAIMTKISSNQDTHDSNGIKPGVRLNPTGKGGFGDHPENRSNGRWDKNNSFSYWFNFFKHLSVSEMKKWLEQNPEDKRTVAADLAYRRVYNSQKDLKEFQEVADRTEGRPRQTADLQISGGFNVALVKFIDAEDGTTERPDDRSIGTETL